MKEIVKTIQIYNFNELDKNLQEQLIEDEKERQEELFCENFLLDDMSNKAIELLEKHFKNNAEFIGVQYDLSYCQGSGAMIEFNVNYCGKYAKIKHYGYYCHERSFIIDSYDLTYKQEEKLKNKIIAINEELHKFGRNCIEYYWNMPNSEVIDILSNHEFLADGTIYA